jgi:U6 snRNA-associated Sm-like protein LSm6
MQLTSYWLAIAHHIFLAGMLEIQTSNAYSLLTEDQHLSRYLASARITMENGAVTQGEGKDPSGFLSEIIGNPVTVKLNSGVVYKGEKQSLGNLSIIHIETDYILGELQSVDGYMNIALEKAEEYVNGVKRRTYGDAFVRGNNGEILSSSARRGCMYLLTD